MAKLFGVSGTIAAFLAQVCSSLNSFAIIILSGWYLGLADHGYFVFGVALCQVVLSLVRALCGETFIVLATRGTDLQAVLNSAVTAAMYCAVIGGVACLGFGLVWPEYRDALVASAVVVLAVCFMDAVRYGAIALKRSYLLFVGDLVGLVGTVIGFIVAGRFSTSPVVFLAVWGAMCCVVGVILALALGYRPVSIRVAGAWLKRNFARSSAFFAEAALGATAGTAILAVMAIVTSSEEISIFRTALTVMGITGLMNNFLRSTVLRELSPERIADRRYLLGAFCAMVAAVSVVVVVFGGMIWLLPTNISVAVFGANFLAVLPVLLPAIIHRLCSSCSTIPTIFLRAQGVTWSATKIRIAVIVVGIIIGPLGAYIAGAQGAILGDMVTYLALFIGLTLLMFRTAART
ncbi:MAG: hypothetical protein Q4A92_04560 [Corynebacterium sp.]|nr:hypothetical protein [Corynebacterium sp.]